MKGALVGKNHDKIGSDDKNAKDTKTCVIKRKLNFQDYKNYLEAAQLENKKHHLEKNRIQAGSLKEFVENNNFIWKKQQRFKSKKHVFTEEISKIASSLNDDKRIQSIDSIGTYAHGTSKDLVSKKEGMRCKNIIKQCKNVWLWLYYKRRHKRT